MVYTKNIILLQVSVNKFFQCDSSIAIVENVKQSFAFLKPGQFKHACPILILALQLTQFPSIGPQAVSFVSYAGSLMVTDEL